MFLKLDVLNDLIQMQLWTRKLACVAWRFKQFEREHTKRRSRENERRSREEPPARMTSIFYCRPYYIV